MQLPRVVIEAFPSVGALVIDPGGTVHSGYVTPFTFVSPGRTLTPEVIS